MQVTLPDGVGVRLPACAREPELTETLTDLASAYAVRPRPTTLAMLAEVLLSRARARLGADPAGAVEDLTVGLEVASYLEEPELSAELYGLRALATVQLAGAAAAIADYDRAVELSPDHPTYRNNRSVARRALGDLTGAVTDARRAVAGGTDSWLYWLTLGEALASRGDPEAVAVVRQAHRINPAIGRHLTDPVFDALRGAEGFPG